MTTAENPEADRAGGQRAARGSASDVVLACYDGSEGSHRAMQRGAELLGSRTVIVLSVWEPMQLQLRRIASFASLAPVGDYSDVDADERAAAQRAAEDGARRARTHGLTAEARVARCDDAPWRTIVDIAHELGVAAILLGSRGRSRIRSELMGSTAHNVLNHAHLPVLVVPEAEPETRDEDSPAEHTHGGSAPTAGPAPDDELVAGVTAELALAASSRVDPRAPDEPSETHDPGETRRYETRLRILADAASAEAEPEPEPEAEAQPDPAASNPDTPPVDPGN